LLMNFLRHADPLWRLSSTAVPSMPKRFCGPKGLWGAPRSGIGGSGAAPAR
jgi:hypothetical protein